MKKLVFCSLVLVAVAFPAFAQVDHDFNVNDVVPIATASIPKEQIPDAVVKAVSKDFAMDNPLTWSKFPYALQEYGWVYDKASSDIKPNRFQVNLKTSVGSDLSAVYSASGILIETKEIYTDAALPATVVTALANSQYKDWKVVGNREVIRYYHDRNSVEQHFRITVEKGNVKRTISFNYQASF